MARIPKLRNNGDGRMFAVYPKSGGKRECFGREAAQEYLGHTHMDTMAIYAERTVRELVTLVGKLEAELFPDYF